MPIKGIDGKSHNMQLKAAKTIKPIKITPLVAYGLGAYTHTHIHACMKVISRNQAHAGVRLV